VVDSLVEFAIPQPRNMTRACSQLATLADRATWLDSTDVEGAVDDPPRHNCVKSGTKRKILPSKALKSPVRELI
jgi:hypothetical protein